MIRVTVASVAAIVLSACATRPEPPERASVWVLARPPGPDGCGVNVSPWDDVDASFNGITRDTLPLIKDRKVATYGYGTWGFLRVRPTPGSEICVHVVRNERGGSEAPTLILNLSLETADDETYVLTPRRAFVSSPSLWRQSPSLGVGLSIFASSTWHKGPATFEERAHYDLGRLTTGEAQTFNHDGLSFRWPAEQEWLKLVFAIAESLDGSALPDPALIDRQLNPGPRVNGWDAAR